MKFGDKVRELRTNANMTQPKLAEMLNMSLSMVKKLEQNERETSYGNLLLLSDIFNCSVDYLLGRTDDPTPKIDGKVLTDLWEILNSQVSIYKRHRLFYRGYELTDDDRRDAKKALELLFRHEMAEINEMHRIKNEKYRQERALKEEREYNESLKINKKDT